MEKRYETKEIINIKEEFTINELALLNKLGVKLKDKVYTEQEFEILDMQVIGFYYENEMSDEEKEECIPLPKGVTRKEYNLLLEKFQQINSMYNF